MHVGVVGCETIECMYVGLGLLSLWRHSRFVGFLQVRVRVAGFCLLWVHAGAFCGGWFIFCVLGSNSCRGM